jgi:hypothetical protein
MNGVTCRRFEENNSTQNHFFYPMAAADRTKGGQVEPGLGVFASSLSRNKYTSGVTS